MVRWVLYVARYRQAVLAVNSGAVVASVLASVFAVFCRDARMDSLRADCSDADRCSVPGLCASVCILPRGGSRAHSPARNARGFCLVLRSARLVRLFSCPVMPDTYGPLRGLLVSGGRNPRGCQRRSLAQALLQRPATTVCRCQVRYARPCATAYSAAPGGRRCLRIRRKGWTRSGTHIALATELLRQQ